MRSSLLPVATKIVVGILVIACAPAPSPTATTSPKSSPPHTTSPNTLSSPAVSPLITPIAAGGDHTCTLTSDGGVKCWGWNGLGQLGNDTRTDSNLPVDVSGLASGISAIAAGGDHTCALTTGGVVKCWGYNHSGQLGNGTNTHSRTPIDVAGLASGVSAIAAGSRQTCALTTGGGVKCWGWNNFGQLGNDATTNSNVPVDVIGLAMGITAISVGAGHACALTTGGGVKCWGSNSFGQLGNDTTISSSAPVDVSGLSTGVTMIATGGSNTCVVTSGGAVRCWGSNDRGQLGSGTTTDSSVPVDVAGLASGMRAIAVSGNHACALTTGGAVKCWGVNWSGQSRGADPVHSNTPVDVSGMTSGVRSIASGNYHTCALTTGSGVKCWGVNWYGQLGNGTTTDSSVPVDVDFATTTSPSPAPSRVSPALPVRGSAREIGEQILIAPGPGGTLFVAVPGSGGSVLVARLDPTRRPQPGWPIVLDGATSCAQLLPVEDGSVRVLCTPDELNQELNNGVRAFAFDSKGRLFTGWPLDIQGFFVTGRVVGHDLTFFAARSLTDVEIEGQPSIDGGLVTVAADGVLGNGTRVNQFEHCCMWAVGPDGIAYGAAPVSGPDQRPADASRMTAVDLSGIRMDRPVSFDGITSMPAFGPGGRVVLAVGSNARRTTRVLVFDPDGQAVAASSPQLPILTAEIVIPDGPYECGLPIPPSPLVALDGTIVVFSEIDTAIVALDASLELLGGWPFRPATPLVRRDPLSNLDGISCPSLAIPAVGPDSTLYLPLQARDATVGGSIVAVGPDGRVRPGWPVELRRPGAEFWSVVVGSDATVYALAIEPEPGNTSSASILAIAPDSTVLYTTTIVEP